MSPNVILNLHKMRHKRSESDYLPFDDQFQRLKPAVKSSYTTNLKKKDSFSDLAATQNWDSSLYSGRRCPPSAQRKRPKLPRRDSEFLRQRLINRARTSTWSGLSTFPKSYISLEPSQEDFRERLDFAETFVRSIKKSKHPFGERIGDEFNTRKLTHCHVPPSLARAKRRPPPEPEKGPEDKVFAPIPLMEPSSAKSLKKMWKKIEKGQDLSDIMLPEEQVETLMAHFDVNHGEWISCLLELHTHHASKSNPITALACNEMIALYTEADALDDQLTSTSLSQLFIAINVGSAKREERKTGKKVKVDSTLDINEFVTLNVHVALKKYKTVDPSLSPRQCLELLFKNHLAHAADDLIDADDFREKLREQNSDYQNVKDIKKVFAQYKGKLMKTFKAFSDGTMEMGARDASSTDLEEIWAMCSALGAYDDNLTKRGVIRPFALSRDLDDDTDPPALKFVSFVEFIVRIACIKYGSNDIALLAGRFHKDDRVLDDDGEEKETIEECLGIFCSLLL